MAEPFKPKRNAEKLTFADRIKSGFIPAAERADWLQNRADLNKAAEDARKEEERQARALAEKRRREAGY